MLIQVRAIPSLCHRNACAQRWATGAQVHRSQRGCALPCVRC